MRLRNLYGKDYEDWNNSQDDLLINMKQSEKVIELADGIIDYMSEQMIMPRIFEDFGHNLEAEEYEEISNKVYNQIKLRM